MESNKFKTVDEYIATFPQDIRDILEELRYIISKAAPKSEEVISYNMPAYKQEGMLVYFAGYKKHIGFYPMPSGIAEFAEELTDFKTSKGAIQFPIDRPLPKTLINKIIKFRIKENIEKAKLKKSK